MNVLVIILYLLYLANSALNVLKNTLKMLSKIAFQLAYPENKCKLPSCLDLLSEVTSNAILGTSDAILGTPNRFGKCND